MAARQRIRGVTPTAVRRLALALPGAEEGTSYGTPAWRVRGELFARLHQNGEDLVVRADHDQRDALMAADPKAFHITDHYTGSEMMLVRLSAVSKDALGELLEASWRHGATTRMIDTLASSAS